MSITAPERSLTQRMDALASANQIRSQRAQLKRDLKAGRADLAALLVDPPLWLLTAKVHDMLLACPAHGRVKTNGALHHARISPSKTVGGLSERQRAALVSYISAYRGLRTGGSPQTHGTDPDAQHMRVLRLANETRYARAQLRERISSGETSVAAVLSDVPAEARTMTLFDLLATQKRWGRHRARRMLVRVTISETRQVGQLTERQRRLVIGALMDVAA